MSLVEIERDTTTTASGLEAPRDWHIVANIANGLVWERMFGQKLTIIEDITVKADGRKWLHISIAKPNRKMPTWEDLRVARTLFIGEARECYQVFAPTGRARVNNGTMLHLYSCVEQPEGVLPNFDAVAEDEETQTVS